MAFIAGFMARHWLGHLIILCSVILAVGCAIGSQYAVKNLVDTLAQGPNSPVWWAFGVLAGLIAADNLSWRVGGWSATRTFVAVTGDVRAHLFRHLLGHSPAYFADRSPGTLAGRITSTANAIYQVESTFAWNVLPPTFAVIGSMLVMGMINPWVSGGLLLFSGGLGALLVRLAAAGRERHHDYATKAATVDGELVDIITNMPLVRAFGATIAETNRFGDRVRSEMTARTGSLRYLEKLRVLHAATTAAVTALLLAWAIVMWQAHRLTTGDIVLVTTMGFTILHGTRDLAVAVVDTVQHLARLGEALSALLVSHDMPERADAVDLPISSGSVTFRNVDFAYGPGRQVLSGFNISIAAGERIGLVGRSGSGKSTLLSLLQRHRELNGGEILIDGRDISRCTRRSLHDSIAVVPQEVMLFHRSVMENIRYGRRDATDEEVREAAAAAGCDFIELLDEGFDTIVGDRGVKLSGGQRQRLAIARAFLRDSPVLLLDEATSALDTESEFAVQRALDRLMTGRTVIAVAHRLSTLQDFDRIVVMQDGRIIQDAPPSVLQRQPGVFRDLLNRQMIHATEEVDEDA